MPIRRPAKPTLPTLANLPTLSGLGRLPKGLTDPTPLYAVAGAGDVAVRALRTASIQAQEQARSAFGTFRSQAGSTYDDLAVRGRTLVDRVREQPATRDLARQAGTTARSAKATGTTARRSGTAGADAVRKRAAATGTNARKTARTASRAAGDASRKAGR